MANGWIKLHRSIFESEIYFCERFTKSAAWIDMILLANHSPKTLFLRGVEVVVNRGEMAFSIRTLSERWKWNERSVTRFLNWLEKIEMIQCKKTNVTTFISIVNYNE